jgi:hypothetical protein
MSKFTTAKQFINQIFGSKVSKTIDSVKPGTTFKGTPKYQKDIIKARSNVQKSFKPINEGIANETRQLRQRLQGMRGERITQSGISKGKDVTPGIYEPKKKTEKKAKGGRVGLKFGSKKSNVQKIQETFGPKKKVPNKFKGFSKLPEKVQQKIDAKLAKKV